MVMRKGMWLGGQQENYINRRCTFILDGASGKDDITEFLDFSKSFSRKSQWGYVYSANNQPEPVDIILIRLLFA
jgi:hypothetical protein